MPAAASQAPNACEDGPLRLALGNDCRALGYCEIADVVQGLRLTECSSEGVEFRVWGARPLGSGCKVSRLGLGQGLLDSPVST